MDVQEIENILSASPQHFPREALEAAIAQPEAVTPMLLRALETAIAEPDIMEAPSGGYMMTVYAMHLLAQFRETAAYPLLVRLFSLDREWPEHFKEDVFFDSLPQVFASVCSDDLAPLQSLVENPALDGYVRTAALEAMTIRVLAGLLARETVIDYFRALLNGKLERTAYQVRSFLVLFARQLHPLGLMPEIRRVYRQHQVKNHFFISLQELQDALEEDVETVMAHARGQMKGLFDDTIAEFEPFLYFEENRPAEQPAPASSSSASARASLPTSRRRPAPVVRGEKIGRNDPCPCGSGKKYKKCCLNKES